MPNHIHLILGVELENIGGMPKNISGSPKAANPTKALIPKVINTLKGLSSKNAGFSLWQRSYHGHIIRDNDEYIRIIEYIKDNPAMWNDDCYYIA